MIGSVYRIIHLHSNICYVGSTLDSVRNRWQGHKTAYNVYLKNDTDRSVSIYPYFEQYGINTFKCILIKEYEVEDKNHLFAYEQLWINKFKPINLIHAFNPLYENKQYQSYKSKQYYEANKSKILQAKKEYDEVNRDKQKEYREANKDKIKQQQKEYKKTDKSKQQQKEYYQANKDKIKQYREANKDKAKQYHQEYHKTDEYKQKQKQYQKTDKYKQYQKQYRERRKQLKEQLEYEV